MADLVEGYTPGPWQVIEKKIPHYHNNGHHTLRMIYTSWEHGQLKDYAPVVGMSFGLPEKQGDPAVPLIWLSAEDARLIAAAPDMADEITRLRAEVERLGRDYETARDAHDRRVNELNAHSIEVARLHAEVENYVRANGDLKDWFSNLKHDYDALRAEVERLRGALEFLHARAQAVSSYGATTGPQWVGLTTALAQARAALTAQEKTDDMD